jgi:formylglycine-generating enzyme required for sulfatase activity
MNLPWMHSLILLAVVVGIWGAWYVVTARSVKVDTIPVDADVSFDELIAPSIDDHWVLRPGARQVIVESQGYKPFKGELQITSEALQVHKVTLSPLPGHLRVAITPINSAAVTIDGLIEATAPTTIRNIEAGAREISVSAERYLSFTRIIEIEGRGIEQQLSVNLRPAWADLGIQSEPSGATLSVDEEKISTTTPLKTEILQGKRQLSLTLDGYKDWHRTLDVVAGLSIDLPPVLLEKADGYISIESNPSGATVTLGSKFVGNSPIEFPVAAGEKHKVSARKDGYKRATKTVTIDSGSTRSINFDLQPNLAAVQFISTPSDAELFINGISKGPANQSVKLPTHAHKIEIRKDGFVPYTATITPRSGIEKRIRVRLKTPSEVTRAKVSSVKSSIGIITNFAGQRLKLFHGGEITMGSSRRDPNRRANEILREANLTRPFYFGVHEVTNGEFRRFLANHRVSPVKGINVDGDKYPVINISWESAALYCNWLSRKDSLDVFYQIKNSKVLGINPAALGYRLPTEAEWSWVARSAPRSSDFFEFPWAGKYPPRGRSGNYADESASAILGQTIAGYNDGAPASTRVGSYPASLRGIHDMGGNVSEWTNDYYAAAIDANLGRVQDPLGPRSGDTRVIRGSNWSNAGVTELRFAYRDSGKKPRDDVGFRIARYAR